MKYLMICLTFIIILSHQINIFAQGSNALSDRYAVVIGISNYKDSHLKLNYAADDAKQFQKKLLEVGRFKKENVRLLTDDRATREEIRKNIEGWLKKNTNKDDVVIIYFSGHGTQVKDTDGDENDGLDECLIPYDIDVDDNSSLISDDVFAYWVRNLESERILIILDNCFSGGAAKEKGVLLPGMKGGKVEDDFSKDLSPELPRRGIALLAASKPEQVSFESDEFKNGVFTHYLIESISSSSDNNFNGIIDAQELFYSVRQKSIEYTKLKWKREQEPIFINSINEDLDVFFLTVKVKASDSTSKRIEELEYKIKNEGNIDKKIELLNEALKLNPSDISINSDIAREYEWSGKYEQAISRYKYILTLDLTNYRFGPPIAARLGELYKKMGKISDAFFWYMKGLTENPNHADICRAIGKLYLAQGDTVSAIQYLNRAINAQPLQKDSYLDLFYIHLTQSSLSTAYNIINNCYNINPNDFQTLYWRGVLEKYYKKNNDLGDSLLTVFESNSGVIKNKERLQTDTNKVRYRVNGRHLNGIETLLYELDQAIKEFPYYADFYKVYIKYAAENKKSDIFEKHCLNYLIYSKLNPDIEFISKYIKN